MVLASEVMKIQASYDFYIDVYLTWLKKVLYGH